MNEGLWRHIEPYVQYWTQDDDPLEPEAAPARKPAGERGSQSGRADFSHASSAREEVVAAAETHAAADAPAAPDAREQSRVSPEQMRDIELIKTRYIVGKRAGRDLIDPARGRTILKKGDVIGPEAIKSADSCGKLVELIVNMVIDEFDDL